MQGQWHLLFCVLLHCSHLFLLFPSSLGGQWACVHYWNVGRDTVPVMGKSLSWPGSCHLLLLGILLLVLNDCAVRSPGPMQRHRGDSTEPQPSSLGDPWLRPALDIYSPSHCLSDSEQSHPAEHSPPSGHARCQLCWFARDAATSKLGADTTEMSCLVGVLGTRVWTKTSAAQTLLRLCARVCSSRLSLAYRWPSAHPGSSGPLHSSVSQCPLFSRTSVVLDGDPL